MSTVIHLYKQYIRGTPKKAIVQTLTVFLCHLTVAVTTGISVPYSKVYIATRVIKHAYDKRAAEEFDYCMDALLPTVKYPDKIYKNKTGKRGSFCFVKKVKNFECMVSLEEITESGNLTYCEIATFFRPDTNYLNNYELLWEWKGGSPSS